MALVAGDASVPPTSRRSNAWAACGCKKRCWLLLLLQAPQAHPATCSAVAVARKAAPVMDTPRARKDRRGSEDDDEDGCSAIVVETPPPFNRGNKAKRASREGVGDIMVNTRYGFQDGVVRCAVSHGSIVTFPSCSDDKVTCMARLVGTDRIKWYDQLLDSITVSICVVR